MREGDDSATGFGENWLYGVAKAGAYGLTRHLANRGKAANIKVNAIAPIAYTVAAQARHDGTGRRPHRAAAVDPREVHPGASGSGRRLSCARGLRGHRRGLAGGGRPRRAHLRRRDSGLSTELDLTLEDVRDNVDRIRDEKGYTVPASSGVG